MFTPPAEVSAVLAAFAPLFTQPSWLRAQALLCGTLLAPANHTVTRPGQTGGKRAVNISVQAFGLGL